MAAEVISQKEKCDFREIGMDVQHLWQMSIFTHDGA